MLKHPIFKKILRILFGSGLLLAIGFSSYGIYEWNMTRTIKTTGLFCPIVGGMGNQSIFNSFESKKGSLYKIEENKRNGIEKISIRDDDKWNFIPFNVKVASITLGKNAFGDTWFKPKKNTVGWYMSSYWILDRTTLIIKRFDADGSYIEGSEAQCEIDNQMIKKVEDETKYKEEARSEQEKEIIENRKI